MVTVTHFVRPTGEMIPIVAVEMDPKTNSILICLENGLSRWFKMSEIDILENSYIAMKKKVV